jgi:hypothetical protein
MSIYIKQKRLAEIKLELRGFASIQKQIFNRFFLKALGAF